MCSGVNALCPVSVHDRMVTAPARTGPRVKGVETLPLKAQKDESWVRIQQLFVKATKAGVHHTNPGGAWGLREAPLPGQVVLIMDYIFNVWKPTGNPRRRTRTHRRKRTQRRKMLLIKKKNNEQGSL